MLTTPNRSPIRRLLTPQEGEPRWLNPAVLLMMVGTSVLYLWNLTISNYGNSFYAAAVRAGSKSWTALLFGSLDANNGITVDKPPAAYWIPALFARVFGFSSLTVMLPQALMGIATVWVVYLTVKRTSGKIAALISGCTMALTPVAVMMFRFNNPDAMLTLCLSLGAYFTVRALQSRMPGDAVAHGDAVRTAPRSRVRTVLADRAMWWMFGTGLILGLAFLVKMLQGFLTIPALALVFLIACRGGWLARIRGLVAAFVGLCLPVLGYAAIFYSWPTDERPYMAGTNGNSFWELVFGYNGLGRIFGSEGNGGGGGGMGGGNSMFGGSTGVLRMFNSGFGTEISWLLPAAAIFLVAGLWFTRRAPRTDLTRAALMIWGGWLVVTAGIFSFMEGTIHPYYVVALAPAVAALIGIGSVELWRGRDNRGVRWVLGAALLATVVWNFALMQSNASSWMPWLRWTLLIGGCLTAVAIVVRLDRVLAGRFRSAATVLALAALVFGGLGSASWGIATAGQAHQGSTPVSGPAVAGQSGGMGGGQGGAPTGATGQQGTTTEGGAAQSGTSQSGTAQQGAPSGTTGQSGTGTAPQGTAPQGAAPGGTTSNGTTSNGSAATGTGQGTGTQGSGTQSSSGTAAKSSSQGGGMGGGESNSELTALLKSTTTKYSAATTGATGAANYMLASDTEVLDIGGWMGSDPYPTLAEFQQMVKDGDISYFVVGQSGGGGAGGSSTTSAIQQWVEAHYKAQTVGGTTVYKLV